MKEWFTAAELASADLPDVPVSKSALAEFIEKRGWRMARDLAGEPLARRRKGRGGGWEYSHKLLPERAQFALQKRALKAQLAGAAGKAEPRGAGEAWQWFDGLDEKKKAKARLRAEALDAVAALRRGGVLVNSAVHEVARDRGVGASTVYAWQDLVAGLDRKDWLPALAPRHAGRSPDAACDPRAWEHLKRGYLTQSKPPFDACYDETKRAADENGWSMPSARTLRRRIETEIPRAVRVYLREGPRALDRLYPYQERDRSMFHALEAINADGHKWDIFVLWPDGTIARPIMLAFQDLYSNKILSWRVDRSENADLVRLAFKDMCERFGIPDLAFLDNGRGFASKLITGQQANRYRFKVKPEEPSGIMTAVGTEVRWCKPEHGQSKPIERAFGDLCKRIAQRPEFEGAYTGNRPDAKPENYGTKAVPLEEFLRVVGEHIALHNARPGRNTRVCNRTLSFDQAFERSYAQSLIRKAGPEQLRMLMLAAESVKANGQSGSVRLLGNRYWAEPLIELAGTPLTVRFDPDALHEAVEVYRQDGSYVCRAECLEAVGYADVGQARADARQRSAWRKHQRSMAEIERSMTLQQWMEALPSFDEPEPPETKLVRMVNGPTVAAAMPAPSNDFDFDEAFSRGMAAEHGHLRLVDDE